MAAHSNQASTLWCGFGFSVIKCCLDCLACLFANCLEISCRGRRRSGGEQWTVCDLGNSQTKCSIWVHTTTSARHCILRSIVVAIQSLFKALLWVRHTRQFRGSHAGKIWLITLVHGKRTWNLWYLYKTLQWLVLNPSYRLPMLLLI